MVPLGRTLTLLGPTYAQLRVHPPKTLLILHNSLVCVYVPDFKFCGVYKKKKLTSCLHIFVISLEYIHQIAALKGQWKRLHSVVQHFQADLR